VGNDSSPDDPPSRSPVTPLADDADPLADDADELWIHVPNWHRFQHYNDRDPSWIKVYTDLTHKPEWDELSLAARGLLVSLWIEYASSNGLLKAHRVSAIVRQKARRDTLDSLLQAGFLTVSASKPLALRARQGREVSKETSKSALAAAHAAPPLLRAPQEEERPHSSSEPHYPGEAVQARQLYNPDAGPERDPDALERIRELAASIGMSLDPPASLSPDAPRVPSVPPNAWNGSASPQSSTDVD